MFIYLLLLFTILPACELVVLIEVGERIGSLNTIFIIILTGIIGASLARLQGFIVLKNIQESLNQGNMPSAQLLDGLMILVGGVVLLAPGFITDFLGFILLIPWTRNMIKFWVKHHFESMIKNGQMVKMNSFEKDTNQYTDIDI